VKAVAFPSPHIPGIPARDELHGQFSFSFPSLWVVLSHFQYPKLRAVQEASGTEPGLGHSDESLILACGGGTIVTLPPI